MRSQISTCYVNSRIAGTEYRTLSQIAETLPLREDKNTSDGPVDWHGTRPDLHQLLKENNVHPILVLDEGSTLSRQRVWRLTCSINSPAPASTGVDPGFFTIVGISNDLKFKDELDPRVLSSLGEEELVFPPYTTEELRAILTAHEQKSLSGLV